jgi:RNA polymerase sigma-70 factor (ECF subfamily)
MADRMDTPLALALPVPHATPRERAQSLTLDEVYRQHFDFVYRKAARLGGPGFDAEDAAQEVFLIVARKLHTYDGSSAVTTWLYGILLNVVRRARRKYVLKRLFERGEAGHQTPAPGLDTVEVAEARRIAYAVLDKLKAKHREVFILSEFEGLSCDEIATAVGCKTETVWSRLHYARKEFTTRLGKRGFGAKK